ncbi:MAG: SpoIID/LytB domain-containing protein, partial [Oscillospiraceae bacterium]|nr:SpoIID/LytB domain-containing protein [Oscillospiraceae bacterium]
MRKIKKRLKRAYIFVALVLAAVVILGAVATFAFTRFIGGDARLITDGGETDGRLRVLLKSLGTPDELNLTLDGVYSLENDPGFRFARGSVLKIAINDGSLWMDCAGVTINMGSNFTLTRHAASEGEPNGIYIAESERPNIYNGDLRLSIEGDCIGTLLYIDLEEYLYGVVPYEMSDSWPLEALKAQSIAARTYALGRKSARMDAEYDLVDTTADQVFKGFSADTVNAIEAVDSTAGVVGMYKGSFATCYYGASNGGQTAMPDEIWGREGNYDYLCVRDDPYDLENPLSVVRAMEIPTDGTALDTELCTLIKSALSEQLASMGYSEDAEDIRIISINQILPCEPKGREGSRMVQTLRFTVQIEAREWLETAVVETPVPGDPVQTETSAPQETSLPTEPVLGDFVLLDEPLHADIGLYAQIKTTFENMDINPADCELYTVVNIFADGTESEAELSTLSEPDEKTIIG